ncbi:hypothetical protein NDU88_002569 [Pleurodeles waltl]|uniref:Uncharacterized protein n=1 Tax=Pleurodeles waltl TaxID=8319 RepID=A0AAV7Q9S1_PLEWA|nr:hypothetical protein NDU88_002569 [Pleurodeles waltl]
MHARLLCAKNPVTRKSGMPCLTFWSPNIPDTLTCGTNSSRDAAKKARKRKGKAPERGHPYAALRKNACTGAMKRVSRKFGRQYWERKRKKKNNRIRVQHAP